MRKKRRYKKECQDNLKFILKDEETKWLQRSHYKELFEGDSNTKDYHVKANGRFRKNRIVKLLQDEGVIEREEYLIKYITNFYKNLFGQPDSSTINLNIQNAPGVTREQAALLIKHFSREELHFCGV